jgi:hypothetical protein
MLGGCSRARPRRCSWPLSARFPSVPSAAGLDASDPANIELLWYKGGDFQKGGTPIPLIFRIATVKDVKPRPGEGEGRHISRGLWKAGGGGGQGQGRGR